MTVYGFHASHEQVHPTELLAAARRAEQAGFTAAMCSDHFSPWSARQGQSAFAWSWLGAALQATDLPFGVVTAPGQRYHPAVSAQAIATLAAMYPGRFWAALGTGEASNEHITGDRWPRKDMRAARLRECVEVIRALLAGEEVSHDEATAAAVAHDQWRSNVFAPPVPWDLELTEHFDEVSRHVTAEEVAAAVNVSADLGRHAAWLNGYAELGFDEIYLHHVGREQDAFVDAFGASVLPRLAEAA